jgi:hypothetical protein
MKVQKLGETVEQYANDIKKLIKRIDGNNRWSEDEKVWQFLKGLRKDIAYQARPFIMSQERPTLEKAIQTAKQFEENAQTYPEAATGYATMTSMNMQGSVPLRNKNNDNDDAIERIVQKAFAPIAKHCKSLLKKEKDRIIPSTADRIITIITEDKVTIVITAIEDKTIEVTIILRIVSHVDKLDIRLGIVLRDK